jgi:phosphate-selective porin OprO/OprP
MKIRSILLCGAALVFSTPALSQSDPEVMKRLDAMQRMIEQQQKEISSQKAEIGDLKRALKKRGTTVTAADAPPPPPPPPVAPEIEQRVTVQDSKIDALSRKVDAAETKAKLDKQEQPKWSFAGGHPQFSSADGRFSLAIKTIAQYDTAYYMQKASSRRLAAANGPDLSSGSNFRRVQLGVQGTLFGDWSYNFNYDFAGAGGTETPGHIQSVYVEYDGLKPFAFRIGAFPPSAGLEDQTGSPDTIFLERNSPSDVARNIAGGDGRDAAAIFYVTDRFYGALSYTGNKVQDSGFFDEQQAVMGRLAALAWSDDDAKLVLSVNGTHVFRVGDTAVGPNSARPITLSDPPEITVDNTGTKLVSTGSLDASSVSEWGVEAGAEWQNLYAQAGYFGYAIDQRLPNAPTFDFDGWYAQATWVLTGESRVYKSSSVSFSNPVPRIPFSFSGGGWGAWELAARYSDMNLNDNPGTVGVALPVIGGFAQGLRGGDQRAETIALNWYPNALLKFGFNYQHINVGRIGTIPASGSSPAISNADVGQNLNIVSLRSQIAF